MSKTKSDWLLELCKEYEWDKATIAEIKTEIERCRSAGDLEIKELTIKDGLIDIVATPHHDLMVTLAAHMREMLNVKDQPEDAGNYVEFQFTAADDPTHYVLTLRPSHKPTPHQLRRLAEKRFDIAMKALDSILVDPVNATRHVREANELIAQANHRSKDDDDS